MSYLAHQGIQTLIHYPTPPHKQDAYKEYNKLNLPVSENIHDTILSIPLHQCLKDEEVDFIIEKLNEFKL